MPDWDCQQIIKLMLCSLLTLMRDEKAGWVPWPKLIAHIYGACTEDKKTTCQSVAEFRRDLFCFNPKVVKLTPEGVKQAQVLVEVTVPALGSPGSVRNAVVGYASKIPRVRLRVHGIRPLRQVKDRWVHAIYIEEYDGYVPSGTPVLLIRRGTSSVEGRIVGQEPDEPILYVLLNAEVSQVDLDGLDPTLQLLSQALLHELAENLESLGSIPERFAELLDAAQVNGMPTAMPTAFHAAEHLRNLHNPWTRLLWGPPGAGKTFAVARLAAGLVSADPEARALLLAPSNLAADVLAEEVIQAAGDLSADDLIGNRKLLRYGYVRKPQLLERPEVLGPSGSSELANEIKRVSSRLREAERKHESEQQLSELRAELLSKQQELAQAIENHATNAQIVVTTTAQAYRTDKALVDGSWDLVCIDEVTMVPPAVCYWLSSLTDGSFLLTGDPRQLGPVLVAESVTNDEQYWMGTDMFAAFRVINTSGNIRPDNPRLVRITEQRRCSRSIWNAVAELYPSVAVRSLPPPICDSKLLDSVIEHGILFFDLHHDRNLCRTDGRSSFNCFAAHVAVELGTSLIAEFSQRKANSAPSLLSDVAIITPYRAQVRQISRLLRAERLSRSEYERLLVGTVHQYQGSAADLVILDLVCAPPKDGLGPLLSKDDGRRLVNVALTRARHGVLILGDSDWLHSKGRLNQNPLLREVLEKHAHRVRVFDGEPHSGRRRSAHDSLAEQRLAEHMKRHTELSGIEAQHEIRREDDTLISRADFAFPECKLAIYVDGEAHHWTEHGWKRDIRLRGELREQEWTVLVFFASQVLENPQECAEDVCQTLSKLRD